MLMYERATRPWTMSSWIWPTILVRKKKIQCWRKVHLQFCDHDHAMTLRKRHKGGLSFGINLGLMASSAKGILSLIILITMLFEYIPRNILGRNLLTLMKKTSQNSFTFAAHKDHFTWYPWQFSWTPVTIKTNIGLLGSSVYFCHPTVVLCPRKYPLTDLQRWRPLNVAFYCWLGLSKMQKVWNSLLPGYFLIPCVSLIPKSPNSARLNNIWYHLEPFKVYVVSLLQWIQKIYVWQKISHF